MNKRIIILGLIAIAVIIFGFLLAPKDKNNDTDHSVSIIDQEEINIAPETRKVFEERLAQAQIAVREVKESDPLDVKFNALTQLGHRLLDLGRYAEAKDSFIQALNLNTRDSVAWANMFSVLFAMRDNQAARDAIQQAISFDIKNPDYWKSYIILERERFNLNDDGVRKLYEGSIKQTDGFIDMHTAYAQFLESIEDYNAAIAQWQIAIEKNSANKELYQQEIRRLESFGAQSPQ